MLAAKGSETPRPAGNASTQLLALIGEREESFELRIHLPNAVCGDTVILDCDEAEFFERPCKRAAEGVRSAPFGKITEVENRKRCQGEDRE